MHFRRARFLVTLTLRSWRFVSLPSRYKKLERSPFSRGPAHSSKPLKKETANRSNVETSFRSDIFKNIRMLGAPAEETILSGWTPEIEPAYTHVSRYPARIMEERNK